MDGEPSSEPTPGHHHQPTSAHRYLTLTNQPSASSSLRRVYIEHMGSGLKTPSTVDERTALLGGTGGTSTPEDLERGTMPKGSGPGK